MNEDPSTPLDEQLLPMLLACDQALADGSIHPVTPGSGPPPELRQRLQDNLACIQLLRQVLPRRAAPKSAASDSGLPLRRLGRFEIHRELGHGAFGMVFLATDSQLGREVALKIPRPEALLTAELRERFVREARAAAGLDHPNVVPVFEAGAEGPICYIASAYCPGITLAEWFANRSEAVPLRQAAMLVATLAEAVQHAHERGVIHRDLKPSNVLLQGKPRDPADANSTVNVPGGGGDKEMEFVPRITDFGLAKLTIDTPGPPGEEGGARTQSGALLGTPNYMAPEQASGKNKEVGPAADVYALGVILYELLTGRPPFLGETVLDTLEQVRNREPLPPRRLRPKLPRDLETICLKCLAKEPRKRYDSATSMGDDLDRYLAGTPIRARPIGTLERGIKWARRKPAQAMLLGAAIALVAVVLGYTVTLRNTVAEKERARRQVITFFQLARFAIDDFATKVSKDKRLQADNFEELRKGLLESARTFNQQIAEQRPDDPDMQEERAKAFGRLAALTKEMGGQQEAIEGFRNAVAAFKELDRAYPGTPRYQASLAEALSALAVAYEDLHQSRLAEATGGESLSILRPLVENHPDVPTYQSRLAGCLHDLGRLYRVTGRPKLAEDAYLEALDLRTKLVQAHPTVAEYKRWLAASHIEWGLLCQKTSHLERAEESYRSARDLMRQLTNDHPENQDYQDFLAASLNNLGLVYVQTNQASEAAKAFGECKQVTERLADAHPKIPEYRDKLARIYNNLGETYESLREPKLAEAAYKESCLLRERLVREYPELPPYRSSLSMTQHNLGRFFCSTDRAELARKPLRSAREIQEKLVRDHPDMLDYRVSLGITFNSLGLMETLLDNDRAAMKWLNPGVEILEEVLRQEPRQPEARRFLTGIYHRRVELLTEQSKYDEALRDLARLLELANGKKSDHWRTLCGVTLGRIGRHGEAMTEVEELADRASVVPSDLYSLACVCSMCSASVRRDNQLSPMEREKRVERYAERALYFLKKAKATGFFTPETIEEMRKDKDLDALRERRDFQELFPMPRFKDPSKGTP